MSRGFGGVAARIQKNRGRGNVKMAVYFQKILVFDFMQELVNADAVNSVIVITRARFEWDNLNQEWGSKPSALSLSININQPSKI